MPENLGVADVDTRGDFYEIALGGGGLQVGPIGTPLKNLFKLSAAITPASVASIVAVEQTFNPAGFASLATGDVIVGHDYPSLGVAVSLGRVRVSATGTVSITFTNPTAGALVPAAGTLTIWVARG